MLSFYVVVPREQRVFFHVHLLISISTANDHKKNKTLSKAVQGVTAVRMKSLAHMTDGLAHAGKP